MGPGKRVSFVKSFSSLSMALMLNLSAAGMVFAEQLAPEFEMERLLLQAQTQVSQGSFDGLRASLIEMEALGRELPPNFIITPRYWLRKIID